MWKKVEIKKTITICIAAFLVVVATVSGTLAYQSLSAWDWSQETNQTISIKLIQEQRTYDAEGTVSGLEPLAKSYQLVPLVQSAQYDGSNFDRYGMPMAEGYVDQIIRVENTGTADAYVRVMVAIPATLDDPNEAGHNVLHWNLGNRFMPDGTFDRGTIENPAFQDISWEFSDTIIIDGMRCNLYTFTYKTPLTAGSTTQAAPFVGFYLDKNVNVVDGHILLNGKDTGFTDSDVTIYVDAQAVQAYGFESADAAFDAGFLTDNPWNNPTVVSDQDSLLTAIESGNDVVLNNDITVSRKIDIDSDLYVDLAGNVLNFRNTAIGFNVINGAKLCIEGLNEGSKVSISSTEEAKSTAILVSDGYCEILGGSYVSTAQGAGTPNDSNAAVIVKQDGVLNLDGANVLAKDFNYGSQTGILLQGGSAIISNSKIEGLAHYTANKAGTAYASLSRGIYNNGGTLTLNNCTVTGLHSGVTSAGAIIVNGGTYEGYGHGGIYFSGANTTSYVKDAIIRECSLPEGCIDDGVAGTNHAGMYIGGGKGKDNIIVYMDSCTITAKTQPIVLRGSSGERNNKLYISNSVVSSNSTYAFRVDKNNTIIIGQGNNFDEDDKYSKGKGSITTTSDIYRYEF